MSKSSTSTARRAHVPSASTVTGGLALYAESLTIKTAERVELVDLTDQVTALVHRAGVSAGIVSLWSMHTTCAVFINEAQEALHADIKQFLEQVVARDAKWKHNDPDHSDCDRSNADSHLRAMLLGHSLTLQIAAGEPVLGQWQRVIVGELDGPRARTIRVQAMGIP